METQKHNLDVYSIITNRIIEQLEKGIVPWRVPWTAGGHPQNLFSKQYYTGINTWLLGSQGFAQNYFLTWNQLKAVGASVKKGEKGTMVLFWKRTVTDQANQDAIKETLRYYFVFNIAQIDDLPEVITIPRIPESVAHLKMPDEIVEQMPNCPTIKHSKLPAFYHPGNDYINIPKQGVFDSVEQYYATLFPELIHSTRHQSRLNQKIVAENRHVGPFHYSIEDLTNEIGACYLYSIAGIVKKDFDVSTAYFNYWVDKLKNDARFIVHASTQAKQATNYILNIKSTNKTAENTRTQELEFEH